MSARLTADDLFAGAGGWDVAADWLDIHARGVENMPEARATREAAGLTTVHDDVWTYEPDGHAAGLIASPPCQTFSRAGSGTGRKALEHVLQAIETGAYRDLGTLREFGRAVGDDRTALVLTPLHFATQHGYEWLAWEQVPSVLPVWEACAEVLRAEGWQVWTGGLSSEQYGVPQTRRRAMLLASRCHPVTAPTPTHSRYYSRQPHRLDAGVPRWVTLAEGLGWPLPHDLAGPCECTMTFTATNPRPNACHRTPCQPAPTMAFGHEQPRWNPRTTLEDGSPRWNDQSGTPFDVHWIDKRPATVVAGRELVQNPGATANATNGSTKSRNDGMRVSPSEAGLLQSFPADYPWQGGKGKQYLQAGNAVPPLMAMAALAAATGEPYLPPSSETPKWADLDLAELRRVASVYADAGVVDEPAFDPPTVLALLDRLEAAEAKVARVEALAEEFAGSTLGTDLPAAEAAPAALDQPALF